MVEHVRLQRPPQRYYRITYLDRPCREHRNHRPPCPHCEVPLTRAPRLVRTVNMRLWHRPRWGVLHIRMNWMRIYLWCNNSWIEGVDRRTKEPMQVADRLPAGDQVCSGCEGRALTSGQPVTGAEPYMNIIVKLQPRAEVG